MCGLVEKLSNSFEKMSRNRSLNPEEYAIAKEKYEAEASNMTRIRSLPVINIPYLKGYNSKI